MFGTSRNEEEGRWGAYGLSDVVDYYGTVGVAIVHGRQRLIALLAGCIPYLELDCGGVVQRYGLG